MRGNYIIITEQVRYFLLSPIYTWNYVTIWCPFDFRGFYLSFPSGYVLKRYQKNCFEANLLRWGAHLFYAAAFSWPELHTNWHQILFFSSLMQFSALISDQWDDGLHRCWRVWLEERLKSHDGHVMNVLPICISSSKRGWEGLSEMALILSFILLLATLSGLSSSSPTTEQPSSPARLARWHHRSWCRPTSTPQHRRVHWPHKTGRRSSGALMQHAFSLLEQDWTGFHFRP